MDITHFSFACLAEDSCVILEDGGDVGRYYIYDRLAEARWNQGTAANLAFLVSAFWHGFYPGV